VLERSSGFVGLVTGDVNLVIVANDPTVPLDEDLGVVAMPDSLGVGLGDLGVAEAESHPEPTCLVEQRLCIGVGHGRLVPVVGLGDVL
jgi:hypothetical protein